MHRISYARSAACSLLLVLGLHLLAAHATAQPDDKDKDTIRLHVDETKLIQMKSGLVPKALNADNAKIFTVELLKDNQNIIKVTGTGPGKANLIMNDGKNPPEIREVYVSDTDEELFSIQRRVLERRREILLQLIRQVVPTANVDVILGLQKSKVAVGIGQIGVPAASGPNDNTVLTGTVILTGTVFETEKVHTIVDLANAVFGGVAQQGVTQGAPAQAPGSGTQVGTAAPPTQGTAIGPGGGQVGSRITVINSLRIAGVHQVELGVVLAVVNRTEARNMGFNWFNNTNSWFLTSFVNPAVGVANSVAVAASAVSALGQGAGNAVTSPPQFGFGVLNPNNGFSGFLQALRAENLVKILAEPRLLTLSGRPANFVDGGSIPVITSSTGGSNVSYLQFGTVVNFVPIVLGNGKIHLEVAASISSPNAAVGVSVATAGSLANAPGLTQRGAQVAVQLEDGQTLAIGGLIQNNINGSTAKIPILGDLPYIGAAFRAVTYSEQEEELLILVTPRLVDPMACNQLKPYPGRETRSADDYELFLEGIMEAPRGKRAPCESGHFVAAHKVPGANDPPFPCGGEPHPIRGYMSGSCSGCGNGNCSSGCANGSCSSATFSPVPAAQLSPPSEFKGTAAAPLGPNNFTPTAQDANSRDSSMPSPQYFGSPVSVPSVPIPPPPPPASSEVTTDRPPMPTIDFSFGPGKGYADPPNR